MVSVTCGIVKEHYDKNMIKGGYHMVSKKMYELGTKKSTIRTIFEFGRKRAAEVGEENIYDFSLGNPNVPTPEFVKQAAIDILQTMPPEAVHGYTIAPGNPQVRETLARSINDRFGTHFAGKNLFMTAGAAAAITICFKALCEEGDEFIAFAPFFPEYRCFVESVGGKLVVVPARVEDFQIDFAAFEARLTPHTKAVIVNSPNNPSGAIYSEETIEELAAILRRKEEEYGHPIYIISDEPYREIAYEGNTVPYIPCYYRDTLVCYSWSKSLSLPGERIGYVAANPRCEDAEYIVPMCGQISRGTGHNCPASLIQLAVAECLDETSDLSVYETNMELIYAELKKLGFTVVKPSGTFYIFPKALEEDANAFCKKAMKYDLALVPGDSFGCPGYFRMAYCIDTEKVRRSFAALEKFVAEEYGK